MVLNNINTILVQAVNSANSSVEGFNSEVLYSGVATFENMEFVSSPGSKNVVFQASSKAINTDKINAIFGSQLSTNQIRVNFRYCMPGEYQTERNH
jgi:hypothetical protein